MCHCLLHQSVENHAIDKWSHCLSACVDAEDENFKALFMRLLLSK